jgi:hypothetical protein
VTAAPTTPTTAQPEPTKAQIAAWPQNWCSIQPGGSVERLEQAMGPPTADDSSDPTDPSLSWDAFGSNFVAFLGLDGSVRQMDIDEMNDSVSGPFPCADTRQAG